MAALALLGWAGAAEAAEAEDSPVHLSLGVTAGTEGVGPEIGVRAGPVVGVRANATFLGFGHGVRSDGIDYRGHVDLASGGLMLDLFPFKGGFFVSGGGRINGNRGRVLATPMQSTQIGSITFTPEQIGTLSGRAGTKNFAPQATIGYAGKLGHGFVLGLEAGALFQGAVRIRDFASNGTLAGNAIFAAQLEQERVRLQDRVNDYKVYPVAQLRLGYRF